MGTAACANREVDTTQTTNSCLTRQTQLGFWPIAGAYDMEPFSPAERFSAFQERVDSPKTARRN